MRGYSHLLDFGTSSTGCSDPGLVDPNPRLCVPLDSREMVGAERYKYAVLLTLSVKHPDTRCPAALSLPTVPQNSAPSSHNGQPYGSLLLYFPDDWRCVLLESVAYNALTRSRIPLWLRLRHHLFHSYSTTLHRLLRKARR